MTYLMIFITAILVNNIVLSQFLGICPFLGVSKKLSTAVGMGFAVLFVMTLSSIVTYLVYYKLLEPNGLEYMVTIAFILVIASMVQMVEIMMKSVSPALHQALGIFLPLITTNCAVLGVAILIINKGFQLLPAVCYSAANALGFMLALVLFAGIREQLSINSEKVPAAMRGMPIALIAAGLLAMAFMGFAGVGH